MEEDDVLAFVHPRTKANFVTSCAVTAPARVVDGAHAEGLEGHIVLIPQADPAGHDWLFACSRGFGHHVRAAPTPTWQSGRRNTTFRRPLEWESCIIGSYAAPRSSCLIARDSECRRFKIIAGESPMASNNVQAVIPRRRGSRIAKYDGKPTQMHDHARRKTLAGMATGGPRHGGGGRVHGHDRLPRPYVTRRFRDHQLSPLAGNQHGRNLGLGYAHPGRPHLHHQLFRHRLPPGTRAIWCGARMTSPLPSIRSGMTCGPCVLTTPWLTRRRLLETACSAASANAPPPSARLRDSTWDCCASRRKDGAIDAAFAKPFPGGAG